MTSQLLLMAWCKVCDHINQWQLIMIFSTDIQYIYDKVYIYSFFDFNLHPHHGLHFSECIKKLALDVKTGGTSYFWNHEEPYYNYMTSIWKNIIVIKQRQLMSVIDQFVTENPYFRSIWQFEPNSLVSKMSTVSNSHQR